MKTEDVKRFWDKVAIGGENECWAWTAGLRGKGYGSFWLDGKTRKTNRVAYKLANGPIPEGLHVLHTCDNCLCVNPDHLWLGTHADNMDDRQARDRQAKGESVGTSKLTREQVVEIRERYSAGGATQAALGEEYGVSSSLVGRVVRRECWGHVE